MPKLTGPDLKSIREGLLLSAQALADRLKHEGLVPVGHVRTVQRWEEGARPVPDDIADYLLELDRQVEVMASRGLRAAQAQLAAHAAGGPSVLAMPRYMEDGPLVPGTGAPHDCRLHAAALNRLRRDLARDKSAFLHLVVFDWQSYGTWLRQLKAKDSPENRAAWAVEEGIKALADYPVDFKGPHDPEPSDPSRTPRPKKQAE